MTALWLLGACAVQPATVPAAPGAAILLPYSLRSMAFDSVNTLWQIAREDGGRKLVAQTLTGQQRKSEVSAELPVHRSLAWGQQQLWLLDYDNTIYTLTPDGVLRQTLELTGLPEPRAAEQLIWSGDELWLLMGAYLSSENRTEPARFYRIDPASGAILATLMPREPATRPDLFKGSGAFSDFVHQNLAADAGAFYVARSNIFDKAHNAVYRIDRRSGAVSQLPLGRIYTGLGSVFLREGQLYGIELLDTSNCAEACRGKLEKLPKPQ